MNISLNTTKILAEIKDGIGWLTINNPERRNAMSLEMWQGMNDAATALGNDPSVRVVVLRGAGGKSFAAGADISEFEQHRKDAEQKRIYAQTSSQGHAALERLTVPLIALIEGFCIGGGLAIALHADVRIATPGSRFGVPAAKLGLGYGYDGLANLARLVGPSVTKDILFSARFLAADEALRVGLLNTVVESDAIEAHVQAYAATIAANAPLTIYAVKEAMRAFEQYSDNPAAKEIEVLVDRCFDSADYKEGREAFLEKRVPQFHGK
jgi:enoyl-CoA hydratase